MAGFNISGFTDKLDKVITPFDFSFTRKARATLRHNVEDLFGMGPPPPPPAAEPLPPPIPIADEEALNRARRRAAGRGTSPSGRSSTLVSSLAGRETRGLG